MSSASWQSLPAELEAEMASRPAVERRADQTAELEAVYRAHHSFVWRSLIRLGVPTDAVDDAVHDTFMVVARRLHEFEGRSAHKTWLFAIAFQIARSFRRDQAKERRLVLAIENTRGAPATPSAAVQQSEAASLLHELLQQLDAEKRAVFIMAELEGMTAPEMAAALGLKVPTVYSRLRLARSQLEKAVAAQRGSKAT